MSNYDKLLLLKQQLVGRALAVVESLESTNQTFTDAKNLLEKAFLDTDSQNYKAIKNLVELKLGLTDDPYCFISKGRSTHENVRMLGLTVHFLQFFMGSNE